MSLFGMFDMFDGFGSGPIADLVAHFRACTEKFCDTCRRFPCKSCNEGTQETPGGVCASCVGARKVQDEDASARHVALATVPSRFSEVSFDSPWLAALVGAAAPHVRGLLGAERMVLLGDPGTGKTSLAVAAYRAVVTGAQDLSRIRRMRFVSAYELAKARARHPLGKGEAPLVEDAFNASLLVIDDLGSEQNAQQSAVTEVIYERHAECRQTWITSFLTPELAAVRYGAGIARRIFEGARIGRLGGK